MTDSMFQFVQAHREGVVFAASFLVLANWKAIEVAIFPYLERKYVNR